MRGFAKFGAIIVMLICFAIPVLTTLSFCFWWHNIIKLFLCMFSFGEIAITGAHVIVYVDEHYNN